MSQAFSEKTFQLKSLQDKLDSLRSQLAKTNEPKERHQFQKEILETKIQIAKLLMPHNYE